MWELILLSGGLLLLIVGAELLVRGSSALARGFGLSELFIGLTVVSFGTSAPELVVSVQAALSGSPGIAVGNVVGSNSFNVLVILGITAVMRPLSVHLKVLRVDGPLLALATLSVAATLYWVGVGRAGGLILVCLLVAYTLFHLKMDSEEAKDASMTAREEVSDGPARKHPTWLNCLMTLGGLGLLIVGSNGMVNGAVSLAIDWGVPEAVIGLTIVACGTSLPELAASLVAAFRGNVDIAVGNIVGSNLFNLLGILSTTALIKPIGAEALPALDLLVMAGSSLLLLPVMLTGLRISRGEGTAFLGIYFVYLWSIWPI